MSTLYPPDKSWGPPNDRRSWIARHKIFTGVIGIVAFLFAIGIIGAITNPQPKTTPQAVATTTATTAKPAKATTNTSPDAPPPTTQVPAPAIKTATYHGSGDSIAKIKKPASGPVIANIKYRGGANFIVTTSDDAQLLVNHIGSYKGVVLLDPEASDDTTRLKVQASGPWTIKLSEVTTAKTWTGHTSGLGDAVLMYAGKGGVVTVTHRGSGNFIVKTYGGDPLDDLMVNKIGNYKGDHTINDGPVLLQVTAGGRWTMNVEED
jgi:cytoskeletal protein RodZ